MPTGRETDPIRILIAGGSGFIGRACVRALAGSGHEVIATCHSQAPPDKQHGVRWVRTDLTVPAAVKDLFARHHPTHLLALAWFVGPGYQTAVENFTWLQHSIGQIIDFAQSGGQRVVLCGTCMEYDCTGTGPLLEGVTPLRPTTEYGTAKVALFSAFEPLCANLGISSAWARPFYLYGPEENPRRLVPDVILSLLDGREALCSHGRQRRDYLHVDDLAAALLGLLLSDQGGAFNIGSGHAPSLAEVIEEIGRQLGRSELIRLGVRPVREDEPAIVQADVTRLRRDLGWQARYDLQTGIAHTIAWWRRQRMIGL